MTTDKQIAANQQNAKRSTGPRSADGKRRSRRNAVRHGLTAETVIDVLENAADYEALAAAINADFRPATNVELQLIGRLVSLLWRLRRATAIESGLLAMHATANEQQSGRLGVFYRLLQPARLTDEQLVDKQKDVGNNCQSERYRPADTIPIARSFLKLASTEGAAYERLGRYETGLWRQTVQVILLLNSINLGANEPDIRHPYVGSRKVQKKIRPIRWPPFTPIG